MGRYFLKLLRHMAVVGAAFEENKWVMVGEFDTNQKINPDDAQNDI